MLASRAAMGLNEGRELVSHVADELQVVIFELCRAQRVREPEHSEQVSVVENRIQQNRRALAAICEPLRAVRIAAGDRRLLRAATMRISSESMS